MNNKKIILLFLLLAGLFFWYFLVWFDANYEIKEREMLNPFVEEIVERGTVYAKDKPTIDELIDKYSKKYANDNYNALYLKQLLHCVAYRESRYGYDRGCGDNGKACGIMQFWERTYINFRKIMIKKGIVHSSGNRLNYDNAIETAAWAIADGRGNDWGPILRGVCK